MPEHDYLLDMERIYGDTAYFINGITEEYSFYGAFIDALRNGGAKIKVSRKTIHKTIEEQWLTAIESCLPALDYSMRNRSVGIEEREDVVPVEFARNITSRSIRHLAQHTDFITHTDGDEITPSKILNVFREETLQTYENKFINTLLQRLYTFVDRRYTALKESGTEETGVALDFSGAFRFGNSNGKIHLSVETTDPGNSPDADSSMERLTRLHGILTGYLDSPFVRSMQGAYIRPPVMRTNAISKNKYLRQCLELWDYIESYEKLGYLLEVEEQAENPGEEFIQELYAMISLQYSVFEYNIRKGFRGTPEVVASQRTASPLSPSIVTRLKRVDAEEFNIYDTEYRRVVNVSHISGQRKLSSDELKIRDAVELALSAQRKADTARRRSSRTAEKRKAENRS